MFMRKITNRTWERRLYFFHCLLLLITPPVCYLLALKYKHVSWFLPAISACYFQYPENVIFPLGVFLFCLSHFYLFGGIYHQLDPKRPCHHFRLFNFFCPRVLEQCCGFFLIFVSVLPFNHPFHGKVALLLFLFLCLWQISRVMVDFYLCRDRRQVHDVRFFLALLSSIFLVGILCFFPYAINHQSMKTSSFLDQVHLLSFHPDWQTAALCEWALFFNTGGFFLTFIDDLSGSKSCAFRQ